LNPNDLELATNSPKTHYALSPITIETLRSYGTPDWSESVKSFLERKGSLLQIYQKSRDSLKIPLKISDGSIFYLSPGKHNELQVSVVQDFGPRFVPGGRLLYIGDTAKKSVYIDKIGFEQLKVSPPSHGKLPDIVLFDEPKNRIFLIEAVTHHGPVSPKRCLELEKIFKLCSASRIYVSTFPDFQTFKKYISSIAWETEVWIAEIPDHMIHFNGERFLNPG
jgi:type II restriction enzyme